MRNLFVYYISILNPNQTLQLTTLRTSVRWSLQPQMFSSYYICKITLHAFCYMHAGVITFKGACSVVTSTRT